MKSAKDLEIAALKVVNMELREENLALRNIVVDLHWMARRYCDGRSSYAPSLFNDHTYQLLKMGVKLNPTADRVLLAHDGQEDIEANSFCIPHEQLMAEEEYIKEWNRTH